MIIDLGTGDGRAVLAAAATGPRALVLGIDADAASMAESSRRAARGARKGGLPNVIFLAAGVDALDPVLDGRADLVTVTLPWGSLLRGALGLAEAEVATRAIARLPKPEGRIVMFVSVTPRDGIPGLPCLDEAAVAAIARRLGCHSLQLVSAHPAAEAELAATSSTWANRLRAGHIGREAWRLELRRLP